MSNILDDTSLSNTSFDSVNNYLTPSKDIVEDSHMDSISETMADAYNALQLTGGNGVSDDEFKHILNNTLRKNNPLFQNERLKINHYISKYFTKLNELIDETYVDKKMGHDWKTIFLKETSNIKTIKSIENLYENIVNDIKQKKPPNASKYPYITKTNGRMGSKHEPIEYQHSKIISSVRQIVKSLQSFINDIDHGVYAQRITIPSLFNIIGYTNNVHNIVHTNKVYQDTKKKIYDMHNIVDKLEKKNDSSFHAEDVRKLNEVFKHLLSLQKLRIYNINTKEHQINEEKISFLEGLLNHVNDNYSKYMKTSDESAKHIEYLLMLSHMSSDDEVMMGGGKSKQNKEIEKVYKQVQINIHKLNKERKEFYNNFKRTVQEINKIV